MSPFYRNDKADDWDYFERNSVGTELKFVFFPKRSWVSGKYIWLTFAYRKTALWAGPGDTIFEHRWYTKEEYIIKKLKQ